MKIIKYLDKFINYKTDNYFIGWIQLILILLIVGLFNLKIEESQE